MSGDERGTPEQPAAEQPPATQPVDRERPVLPDVSRDETDVGWGDEPGQRDAEWYHRERPPHHE